MPKNPNVRPRKENSIQNDPVAARERGIWLTNIKAFALAQLPGSASPKRRVQLRKRVEEEMRAFGSDSPAEEIHDVLHILVKECTGQTATKESTSSTTPLEDERKPWLDRWKEKAVAQLPSTASAQRRAALRRKVEQALEGHGPHDAGGEIGDIVATVVTEITFQLEMEAMNKQRLDKKQAMINLAEKLLALAIPRFPASLVGTSSSWERHHLVESLKEELRSHLQERLTGDESMDELGAILKAFVGGWEKSAKTQAPGPGGFTRRAMVAGVAAMVGVGTTFVFPSIREKAKNAWHYLQTEGGLNNILTSLVELYEQKQSDSEPPPQDPPV